MSDLPDWYLRKVAYRALQELPLVEWPPDERGNIFLIEGERGPLKSGYRVPPFEPMIADHSVQRHRARPGCVRVAGCRQIRYPEP
jgi:hypothetical protein